MSLLVLVSGMRAGSYSRMGDSKTTASLKGPPRTGDHAKGLLPAQLASSSAGEPLLTCNCYCLYNLEKKPANIVIF